MKYNYCLPIFRTTSVVTTFLCQIRKIVPSISLKIDQSDKDKRNNGYTCFQYEMHLAKNDLHNLTVD